MTIGEALSNVKHLLQTVFVNLVDVVATDRTTPVAPDRLLLLHLDAIGDYILFRNFIPVLREHPRYRSCHVTLCGNAAYRELAESLDTSTIDEFIWINRDKFRYNVFYRHRMVREISRRGFNVALYPAYSRNFYWGDTVVRASGAAERTGSCGDATNAKGWQKKLGDSFYTRLLPATPENIFEFERNREFFQHYLGTEIPLIKPSILVKESFLHSELSGPYVVVLPGAGERFREWSTDNFAVLAKYIFDRYGFVVVLAGGGADRKLSEEIERKSGADGILDLTGRTSLTELTRLIAGAELVVGNESGGIHMAVAVNTDAVCISNGNQLGRFSPYPPEIYDRVYYAYPEPIASSLPYLGLLGDAYRYRSRLDIDTVNVSTVKGLVDAALARRQHKSDNPRR